MMKNTHDIIEKMSYIAQNAMWTENEVTPAYVAWMANVSIRFAGYMIQYWEGAGKPVAE